MTPAAHGREHLTPQSAILVLTTLPERAAARRRWRANCWPRVSRRAFRSARPCNHFITGAAKSKRPTRFRSRSRPAPASSRASKRRSAGVTRTNFPKSSLSPSPMDLPAYLDWIAAETEGEAPERTRRVLARALATPPRSRPWRWRCPRTNRSTRFRPTGRFASAPGWSTRERSKRGSPSPTGTTCTATGFTSPSSPQPRVGRAVAAEGKVKDDEFFGRVETYRGEVVVKLSLKDPKPGQSIVIAAESQGCADIGVCYPPTTQRVTLSAPDRTAVPLDPAEAREEGLVQLIFAAE